MFKIFVRCISRKVVGRTWMFVVFLKCYQRSTLDNTKILLHQYFLYNERTPVNGDIIIYWIITALHRYIIAGVIRSRFLFWGVLGTLNKKQKTHNKKWQDSITSSTHITGFDKFAHVCVSNFLSCKALEFVIIQKKCRPVHTPLSGEYFVTFLVYFSNIFVIFTRNKFF